MIVGDRGSEIRFKPAATPSSIYTYWTKIFPLFPDRASAVRILEIASPSRVSAILTAGSTIAGWLTTEH